MLQTCTHIALSPVSKINLLKMLLHYKAAPDQQRATVQPAELIFFLSFFAKIHLHARGFDLLPNFCYGNLAIKTNIFISCILIDRYGIFQMTCVSFTVTVTPVLLYCPSCYLLAESV